MQEGSSRAGRVALVARDDLAHHVNPDIAVDRVSEAADPGEMPTRRIKKDAHLEVVEKVDDIWCEVGAARQG